jgi:hypothetical protein
MTDERHDDEVLGRALSRAIETQTPNETPFERSRIADRPARRGFNFWQFAGVAAALVLALAFGSWFTRPAGSGSEPGPVGASTTPTPSAVPTTGNVGTQLPAMSYRVFFVRDMLPPVSALVQGPPFVRAEDRILTRIGHARLAQSGEVPFGATNPLALVAKAPASPPDSFSADVSVSGDTATVEFTVSNWGVRGAAQVQALVQQLVYVITEEPGVRKARIVEKGKTSAVIDGLVLDRPLSREDVTDYAAPGSTTTALGYGDTNPATARKLTMRTSVNSIAPSLARFVIETDLQVPLPNALYPDFKVEVVQNNELSNPAVPGKWRMIVTVNGQDSSASQNAVYQQIDESPVRGVLTTRQGNSTVYQIGLDDLRPWRTALAFNPIRIIVDVGGDPRTIIDSNAVYTPAVGATVGRTFQVSGVAHNFEAHVDIRVLDDKQKEIVRTSTLAANCCDPGGTFDATVQLPANVTGRIYLEVFEASARDGSDTKLIRIPLTVR